MGLQRREGTQDRSLEQFCGDTGPGLRREVLGSEAWEIED
jgi:hypothetical protein